MDIEITKKFSFEAAHMLPMHDGKCARLHGHSYVLEVTVSGPLQESGSARGMVMDFADLSKVVDEEIVSQWDHQYLNDLVPFDTTAENLALECAKRLQARGLPVSRIVLHETRKSSAAVTVR